MRFGFYTNPQTPGPDADGGLIEEVLSQIELAEEIGFDDVWLTEHHFLEYNVYSDPLMFATAIAHRTKRLRIGFSLAVVPFHHPIRFVTQCNLLDQFTRGRFVLGVGPGNCPIEFEGYGHHSDERHAMMHEFMAVVEKAWESPPGGFTYSGKFYNGKVQGRIIPTAYQKPHPLVAWATLTTETFEMAGRKGYAWLIGPQGKYWLAPRLKAYFAALEESGLSEAHKANARSATGMNRHIYVAAPGEDWRKTLDPHIDVYVRKSALSNTGIDNLPKEDFERRKDGFLKNWLVAGTADEVVDQLRFLPEHGVGHLMCWLNWGHLPDRKIRDSMYRLAADVIPELRKIEFDPAQLDRTIAETPADATFWTPSIGATVKVADVAGEAYIETIKRLG